MSFRIHVALLSSALLMSSAIPPAHAQHLAADGAGQTFNFLSDQYFEEVYFKFAPTTATQQGLHDYDTQLEDYSAASVQKEIAALQDWEKKISAIPADGL